MKFKCSNCNSNRIEIKDKKELIKYIQDNSKKAKLYNIIFKCKNCSRKGTYYTDYIVNKKEIII